MSSNLQLFKKALFFCLLLVMGLSSYGLLAQAAPVIETDTIRYPGEPIAKTLVVKRLKSAEADRVPFIIELAAPDVAEVQALAETPSFGRLTQVGFGRALPEPYHQSLDLSQLTWTPVADGGQAAVLTVTSPSAAAIRLLLDVGELPEGTELRFFDSSDSSDVSEPITRAQGQQAAQSLTTDAIHGLNVYAPLWSPVIKGDSIGLEIYLPVDVVLADIRISLLLVSHLVDADYHPELKILADVGKAAPCEIDVACDNNGIPSVLVESVAKIRFSKPTGDTFLCSGTLLNDTDESSLIPYFYTANHCISDQTTASSLELFWFFQRTSCAGPDPASVTDQKGGSKLLVTNSNADYTLLQLNSAPPAGVGFSGWTTAALHDQPGFVGLHHPAGDVKKISRGKGDGIIGIYDPSQNLGDPDNPNFFVLRWEKGITEPGSSGSGVWANSNGQLRLAGTLTGGSSSCEMPIEADYYGRFDAAFPALADYLDPVDTNVQNSPHLKNISTNLHVDQTGAIAGFIVTGTEPQRFVLMGENVGSLENPQLELSDMLTGQQLAFNDDWQDHATASEVVERDREPNSARAAAFAVTLSQGIYLAKLSGAGSTTGRGVVSITQVDNSPNTHLLNISTNGFVDVEGTVAGFIVSGEDGGRRFVVMGEGLDGLTDPMIEVTNINRNQSFGSNDNWRDHATADEVVSKDRAPRGELDAALALTLEQGIYLAILKGKNGATGRGLISVTEVPD